MYVLISLYMYIYIYREREREIHVCIYIYIYIYVTPPPPFRSPDDPLPLATDAGHLHGLYEEYTIGIISIKC